MPDKHCLLSASSSHRYLNCEKSVEMTKDLPNETSIYAETGTIAHRVCEIQLKKMLDMEGKDEPYPEGTTQDNIDNANEYAGFIQEFLDEYKQQGLHPIVLIEQEVSYSDYIPDSFGTSDCIILTEEFIHIIDYKNGSMKVDVENNSQLMIYGLGAIQNFDYLFDVKTVRLSIFQPNISNYGTWEISKDDLIDWGLNVLKPAGERILNKHDLSWKSGDWCIFCKAKANCRKRAEENLCLAAKDFAMPDTLTPEEIGTTLSKIDDLVSWANDVKDYALAQALQGVHYEGWKVVEGRSNRKYKDENEVAEAAIINGFDPYVKKVATITELQKRMGKAKFEELIASKGLVIKPAGSPTLVTIEDKRPELVLNSAQEDFKNLDNSEEN